MLFGVNRSPWFVRCFCGCASTRSCGGNESAGPLRISDSSVTAKPINAVYDCSRPIICRIRRKGFVYPIRIRRCEKVVFGVVGFFCHCDIRNDVSISRWLFRRGTCRCSIEDHMTLLWKTIVGVVHQPYQGKRCDEDGRHAE